MICHELIISVNKLYQLYIVYYLAVWLILSLFTFVKVVSCDTADLYLLYQNLLLFNIPASNLSIFSFSWNISPSIQLFFQALSVSLLSCWIRSMLLLTAMLFTLVFLFSAKAVSWQQRISFLTLQNMLNIQFMSMSLLAKSSIKTCAFLTLLCPGVG